MEDIPSFSSKGSAIPRGVDSTAQDANPSERSGARLGKPVWRQFVDNEAFQEQSKGAIRAEREYQRQTALDNRQPDEKWGGDNGRLFRRLGRDIEEHDPEQFADDPVVGPVARKSLWDREVRTARKDAEGFSLLQGDPSFKARELKDKDREEAALQVQMLPDGDANKEAAKARLASDDEYRKTKTDLEQKAYDAKARAFALENTHPDEWWQQRRMERKDAVVGEVQTRRGEIDTAEASAMEHKAQLQARKAAGVTGDQVAAIQQEEAEVDSALEQLVAKRGENEGKLEAVSRGFIDNTVTALKRGYAGAAQASNILQGATDQTNAEDIVRYDAMKKANPASKEFQAFMQAKGFVESAKAFMSNPVRIITEVMAESAAQMAPSIALGVLGGSVGGAVVAAPTAEVGAPVTVPVGAMIGGAIGAGSGSALAEYGSSMMQAMEEAGMDPTKPESIKQFFNDPAKLAKAKEFAVKRGVAVGLFDAVSAGLAGKFMKPLQVAAKTGQKVGVGAVLAASGKEVGMQAAAGGTGEAAGQWASTGEIKDAKSIFLEGIAEVGSAPFEVASNLRDFSKKPLAPDEVDLVKPDVDMALAAIAPEAPAATPEEIREAQFITRPEDGAAGVAEAVVIGRELAAVDAEDTDALEAAQEEVDATRVVGGDAKPAEAKVEIVKKKTGRAPLVKAALKIATGRPMHSLSPTELGTLGFKTKNGKISEMSPTELEAAGLEQSLVYEGDDKSPILRDEAKKKVAAISATAAGQIKLTEDEARAKATKRAEALANPPAWDVMVDDGSTVRVNAPDAVAAELAVAQGGQRVQTGQARRVANENQGQGTPAPVPVQVPPVPTPTPQNPNAGASGGAAGGAGAAKAGTQDQVARTVARVREKIARVKANNPKLAGVIEETSDGLAKQVDGKILVNPERIVADAIKANMSGSQTIEYFNRVLDEEIRHLAYRNATADKPEAYFVEMWQTEFVATGKDKLVRTAYGKKTPGVFDSLSPRQKLEEAIRLISQGGNATEYSALLNKKFGEQFLDLLRSVLAELKKLAHNPVLKAEVDKLEAALKVLVGRDASPIKEGDIVTHNGRRAEVIRPVVNGWVAIRYAPKDVDRVPVGEVVKVEAAKPIVTPDAPPEKEFNADGSVKGTKSETPKPEKTPQPVETPAGESDKKPGKEPIVTPPAEGEQIDTIAGKMSFVEFERQGYAPDQVTKADWVNLMRSERRRLGQSEAGDNKRDPWGEYENYHEDRVREAVAKGEQVDPEVLKDYPDLAPPPVAPEGEAEAPKPAPKPKTKPASPSPTPTGPQGKANEDTRPSKPVMAQDYRKEFDEVKKALAGTSIARSDLDGWLDYRSRINSKRKVTAEESEKYGDDFSDRVEKELKGKLGLTQQFNKIASDFEIIGKIVKADPIGAIDEQISPTPTGPLPEPTPGGGGKLTPDEQAAKDFFNELGEGLESAPIVPTDFYKSKGIPREKRVQFMGIADGFYDAGVRTPADVAAKLEKIGGGKLRAYSDAVWNAMRTSYPSELSSAEPDWVAVYGGMESVQEPEQQEPTPAYVPPWQKTQAEWIQGTDVRRDRRVSAVRDVEDAVKRLGREKIEMVHGMKPGESVEDWLHRERQQQPVWSKGRKTGQTAIQKWGKKETMPIFKDTVGEEELRKAVLAFIRGYNDGWMLKDESVSDGKFSTAAAHRKLVERAVREKEDVPDRVLADYPELQPKVEAPAPVEPVTPPADSLQKLKAEVAAHNDRMTKHVTHGEKVSKMFAERQKGKKNAPSKEDYEKEWNAYNKEEDALKKMSFMPFFDLAKAAGVTVEKVKGYRLEIQEDAATEPEVVTPPAPVVKAAQKVAKAPATAPKKLKAQKEYLLAALDKAIEEAPDTKERGFDLTPEGKADMETADKSLYSTFDKAERQNLIEAIYAKYSVPFESTAAHNKDKSKILQAIRTATYTRPEKLIEISVPGDGTFRIVNDKQTLKDFRKLANTRFPTNAGTAPQPTNSTPRATAITKLETPQTNREFVEIAGMFVSSDEARWTMMHVHSDGENVVGTNGQQIIVLKRKIAGTEEAPIHLDPKTAKPVKFDEEDKYPGWKQVVPTEFSDEVEIDTAAVQKIAIQANAMANDKERLLYIWRDSDGKMGYTLWSEEGMFAGGEADPEKSEFRAILNVFMLLDGLKAIRMLGHEKVKMKFAAGAVMLEADGVQYVQGRVDGSAYEPGSHPLSEKATQQRAEQEAADEAAAEAKKNQADAAEAARIAKIVTDEPPAPAPVAEEAASEGEPPPGLSDFNLGEWLNGENFEGVPRRIDTYRPGHRTWGKDPDRGQAIQRARSKKQREANLKQFETEILPTIIDRLDKEQLFSIARETNNLDALKRSGYRLWRVGDKQSWIAAGDPQEKRAEEMGAAVIEGATFDSKPVAEEAPVAGNPTLPESPLAKVRKPTANPIELKALQKWKEVDSTHPTPLQLGLATSFEQAGITDKSVLKKLVSSGFAKKEWDGRHYTTITASAELAHLEGKAFWPDETNGDVTPTPKPGETIERGDEVEWTTGRGDKATSTVDRIRDGVAQVEWFGLKFVPVGELTLKAKSVARQNREKAEANKAAEPAVQEAPARDKKDVFSKKEIASLDEAKTPDGWKTTSDSRMNTILTDTKGVEWAMTTQWGDAPSITLSNGSESFTFVRNQKLAEAQPQSEKLSPGWRKMGDFHEFSTTSGGVKPKHSAREVAKVLERPTSKRGMHVIVHVSNYEFPQAVEKLKAAGMWDVGEPTPKKPKPPTVPQLLENYFRPGKVIQSYGGGTDTVVSFQPEANGMPWSVTVQSSDDNRVRTHGTQPSNKELAKAWTERDKSPARIAEENYPEDEARMVLEPWNDAATRAGYTDAEIIAELDKDREHFKKVFSSEDDADALFSRFNAALDKGIAEMGLGKPSGIQDFGEKIGGARKDKWKDRGLSTDDLGQMTNEERQSYVTKTHVFGNFDYEKLVEDGMPQKLAWIIKKIKDKVAIAPESVAKRGSESPEEYTARTQAEQAKYVEIVGKLRDGLKAARSLDDIKAMFDSLFPTDPNPNIRRFSSGENNANARLVGGSNLVSALQPSAYDLSKADREVEKTGWPSKADSWKKNFRVVLEEKGTKSMENGEQVIAEKDTWYVVKTASRGWGEILQTGFETEDAAIEFAKEQAKGGGAKGTRITRPYNPDLKRTGPAIERNENVTGQDLLDAFGFRGGEFGLWTNEADRQQSLNQAYDGLMDLARVLGIPPKAISLNGALGIAFGARGNGSGSAHYEPGKIVINLTKTAGAGALAHEWGHAVDDHFGKIATGKAANYLSHDPRQGDVRAEVYGAWSAVMSAITTRQASTEATVAEATKERDRSVSNIKSWLGDTVKQLANVTDPKAREAIENGMAMLLGERPMMLNGKQADSDAVVGAMSAALKGSGQKGIDAETKKGIAGNSHWLFIRNRNLEKAIAGEITRSEDTDIRAWSKKQGKNSDNYWNRLHELFARSFESFVAQKLEDNGEVSPYLVQGIPTKKTTQGQWEGAYPVGRDAVAIHDAFSKLFDVVESVETDKGTTLRTAPITAPEEDEKAPRKRIRYVRSEAAIEELAKDSEGFKNWFSEFKVFLEDFLKDHAEYAPLVNEFLSATSAATKVSVNVPIMVRVLKHFIATGEIDTKFLAHRLNLERAARGEKLEGPKISEYSDAVFGRPDAIPVDRHIAQIIFGTPKPNAVQIAAAKRRIIKIAKRLEWEPRQVMAALWAANQKINQQPSESYERHLERFREEIHTALSADRIGEGRGISASRRIAERIRKAGGSEGDAGQSDSLRTAPITAPEEAFAKNQDLFRQAEMLVPEFGPAGADPKIANPGMSPRTRDSFDIARMIYDAQKQQRKDVDTHAKGREMLEKYPDEVERLLVENAYGRDTRPIADYEQHAINLLLERTAAESIGDPAKMRKVYILATSNAINGTEQARAFRQRMDRFMTREERALAAINAAIFKPSKSIEQRARLMAPREREGFLMKEAQKRIDEVNKELQKQLGLKLEQIGKNRALRGENSRLMAEVLKVRGLLEQDVIKMVQHGATIPDIQRRFGKDTAAKAQAMVDKARADAKDRMREMFAQGMTREQIEEEMKNSLKSAPITSPSAMTPEALEALMDKMLVESLGLPVEIPKKALPRMRKPAEKMTDADIDVEEGYAADQIAQSIIDRIEKNRANPPDKRKLDPIRALVAKHTRKQVFGFARLMKDLGVSDDLIEKLNAEIAIERKRIAEMRKNKPEKKVETHPLSANWARPFFYEGMKSYKFNDADRAGIMERVEIIRNLAGAVGKIDSLTDKKRAEAESLLKEIDGILAKYGATSQTIFEEAKGIEEYGFDLNDIAQVAAVARTINALDADFVDKATEYLYFSMLSGLQTMFVNATAIVPAVWESTVGRGLDMAINWFVKNPMSAQYGEGKYILRALGPAISRAQSNFVASMKAQHPMFDRDVNAMEIDWDKILGGGSHRMIGSIRGKKGDLLRIPMRLLTATDDFNRTLIACAEVGTFAYRMAKAQGMKDGSPEMDKFILGEVNTPGSVSYQLASQKASKAIFSNPLPGQRDPHTGKAVPRKDIGDVVGFLAYKLTSAVTEEHDNIFAKAASAALRIAFFPFQRTPFNILRKGVRYTLNPISLFDIALGVTRNAKNAEGKWQWKIEGNDEFAMKRMNHRAELIERLGQQLQGAILMTLLMATAAGEGDEDDQDKRLIITGSSPFLPTGRSEREAKMRNGLGPFRVSFRNADGSERLGFGYGRIEPVATLLAATIDTLKSVKRAHRSGKDNYDAAAAALGGLVAQAHDKSFTKGISDFIGLASSVTAEPDLRENRKALQFLAARTAMVVPNFIKQPIRESDSNFRDRTDSFMGELMYQMVPAGQKPAKVDPYGAQVMKPGTPAGRMVDVLDTGTTPVNKADAMLMRWSDKHPDKAWFPNPIVSAKWTHQATKAEKDMTAAQLAEFREITGKRVKALMAIRPLNFANPTERDVEEMKSIHRKAREDAKKLLSIKFSSTQSK